MKVSKYSILTKYIPMMQLSKEFGEWVIDKENDGSIEHPIQFPFVSYSELVRNFVDDVYTFEKENKNIGLNNYGDILKANGLKWDMESMANANISNFNEECILALIMGAVRAERFCDGALLDFFEKGCILTWLQYLKGKEETK